MMTDRHFVGEKGRVASAQKRPLRGRAWLGSISAVALAATLGLGGVGTAAAAGASQPKSGGTMTILEAQGGIGGWEDGLDPATDTCCSIEDEPQMDAIYGQLFTQSPKGQPEPDLATGWKFLNDDKTVDIFLRHGVNFTDGTPFNAAAVQWNIQQDLLPTNQRGVLITSFPVASVTTQGQYTVVLHLTQPFAPLIDSFISVAQPNWIASPTAFKKMGAKAFAMKPVGAGPFEVVSDTLSSQLVLKKNPDYWQQGHPYLDGVIFKSIGTDQASLEALEAGQAQVAQEVGTLSVVQSAQKNPKLQVVATPGSGTGALQLNTAIAPFNNIKAREAVYYALNQEALNKVLAGGAGVVEQTGDGPASLFRYGKVPGYRSYDLAKAKALVQQLGGLSFTFTGDQGATASTEAYVSEFEAAGMHVTITTVDLAELVQAFEKNSWQITGGGAGGLDPGIGVGGMTWRVESKAPFTGIHSAYLDKLIDEGAATTNHAVRSKLYRQIFQYMSNQALMPFLYAGPFYNITTADAHGPGLSSPMYNPYLIEWPDIWMG